MPALYGAESRTYARLEEEIVKATNDHTILLWGLQSEAQYEEDVVQGNRLAMVGMLAEAPRNFNNFNNGLNGTPFDTSPLPPRHRSRHIGFV